MSSRRIIRSPHDKGGGTTRRGWRRGRERSVAKGQYWSQRRTQSSISSTTKHRLKIALLSLASFAILVAIILIVTRAPRNTPLLTIGITDYPDWIPPNALAVEDIELLDATLSTENFLSKKLATPPQTSSQFLKEFGDSLSDLRKSRQQSVIIYITAHGVIDDAGKPCLLLPESTPHDVSTWLPVADILAAIKQESRLAGANKLLVLDCGRIQHDWALGQITNGFVPQLNSVVSTAAVPGLHVLTSSSGEQGTFGAPELGCSPFGYFLARALRSDQDVTYGDLLNSLQRSVDVYARRYRGTDQVPVIMPALTDKTKQMRIVYATGKEKPAHQPLAVNNLLDGHRQLDQVWDKFNALWDAGAYRFNPTDISRLMHRLRRLEQLLTAGRAYQDEFEGSIAAANNLADRIREGRFIDGELGSLALKKTFQDIPADAISAAETAYAKWLERKRAAALKPTASEAPTDSDESANGAELTDQAVEPPPDDPSDETKEKAIAPVEAEPPVPYQAAAMVAWQQLCKRRITVQEISRLLEFVGESDGQPLVDDAELHLAKILRDGLDLETTESLIGDALQAYALAQAAAVSRDVRTRYWAQTSIDTADRYSRAAIDALFRGDATSHQRASKIWNVLADPAKTGSYANAIKVNDEIGFALDVRDRVWMLLPPLGEWLLGRAGRCSAADVKTLAAVIEDNHRLASLIEQHSLATESDEAMAADPPGEMQSSVQGRLAEINRLARSIDKQFEQQLLATFEKTAGKLDTQQTIEVSEVLRDATAILQTPVPTKYRSGLRQAFLNGIFSNVELEGQIYRDAQPSVGDNPLAHAQWLAGLAEQPALDILNRKSLGKHTLRTIGEVSGSVVEDSGSSSAIETTVGWQAAVGKELRLSLSEIQPATRDLSQRARASLQASRPDAMESRRVLSQGERLLRAAAAMLPGYASRADICAQLNALDHSLFLQWHAMRSLRDAWGPTYENRKTTYFSELAEQQLKQATQVYDRVFRAPVASKVFDQTQDEITKSRGTFVSWRPWRPKGPKDITYDGQRFCDHQMEVSGAPGISGELAVYVGLPALTSESPALVPLHPRRGVESSEIIRRRGVPAQETTDLRHKIEADETVLSLLQLEAVAVYRGHLRTKNFYIGKQRPGPTTVYAKQPIVPPTIKVGALDKKVQIVFVFDCSGSMKYRHYDSGDGSRNLLRRLDIAKTALTDIINNLDKERYEVAVVLYGHRVGWKRVLEGERVTFARTTNSKLLRYLDQPDPAVTPGDDVRTEITMQRLDGIRNGMRIRLSDDVSELLNEVSPLGETPLYLALIEALGQFRPGGEKYVIAITDGANYQRKGTKNVRTAEQVLTAWNQAKDTRINILGIAGPPDDSRDRMEWEKQSKARWEEATADLRKLCREANGKFYDIENPNDLLARLESSIRPGSFDVTSSAGRQRERLGERMTLRNFDPNRGSKCQVIAKTPDEVAIRSEVMRLDGGEAIELQIEDNELVHSRFSQNLRDSAIADNGNYFVGGHLPTNLSDGVAFYVSFQNGDEKLFSRRPAHVWAEFTPAGEREKKFISTHPEWMTNTSVPVARFRLSNWPEEARTAEIKLWFTMNSIRQWSATRDVVLDPEEEDIALSADSQQNAWTISAIQARDDKPLTVVLTEVGTGDQHLVRLDTSGSVTPDMIHRRSLAGNKTKHELQFNAGLGLGDRIRVKVLPRRSIVQQWIEAPKLKLDIPAR